MTPLGQRPAGDGARVRRRARGARWRRPLLTIIVLAAWAVATAAAPAAGSGALEPVADRPTPTLPATVRSADGSDVTVESVRRIVSLSGSLSEIVYALGLGDHLVGRDVTTTLPALRRVPVVTHGHDVGPESVLSRRPTLVLAQRDSASAGALARLRDAGVPVVVVEPPASVDDIEGRVHLVAAALGVDATGELLAGRIRDELEAASAAIPARVRTATKSARPRVAFLYMRGQAGVYLIGGPGSGADSMIAAAGAVDAGTALGLDKPFTPITSEALVEAAPDVILMTTTGLASVGGVDGLVDIPGIAQTPAGINRRVITEEDGLLYSFGSRTPEALRNLIHDLYRNGRARAKR